MQCNSKNRRVDNLTNYTGCHVPSHLLSPLPNPSPTVDVNNNMSALDGKVFCFTGKISMSRAEAKKLVEDNGGRVVTAMSGKVTHLVAADGAITEKAASTSDSTVVWTEQDLKDAVAGAGAKKPAAKKAAPKKTPGKKVAEDVAEEAQPPVTKGAKKAVPAAPAATTPAPPAATPAAAAGGGGRVVDRLVPGRENYKVYEDFAITLNQTNIGQNNNKYYIIQLLQNPANGQYACWTRWGRVGEPGQNMLIPCGTNLAAAQAQFVKKFKDKSSNDWYKRDKFTPVAGKYSIVETEEKEGGDGDSSAPMGKLSKTQIEKGQAVLEEISQVIATTGNHAKLVELSSKFYTLIPTNVGRQLPPPLTNATKVSEKEELLKFYLRMGFDVVEKGDNNASVLHGMSDLPLPKTLFEAVNGACGKPSIDQAVSKGDLLCKKSAGKPIKPMSKEEYGSIMLYTSNAIYRDLNKVLREENRLGTKRYLSYLRLLFHAADCLPKKSVKLWRGITVDLSQQYVVGSTVTWWAVSSCTSEQSVARNFMNGCGGDCSFLTIDTKTAVDISEITFYSNEKESLLLPGTQLLVKSVEKKGKIAEIHLEEVGRVE